MEITDLYGRLLTDKEIDPQLIIQLNLTGNKAMIHKGKYIICQRCNFKNLKRDVQLPNCHFYCKNCIQLGRITDQNMLYEIKEPNEFKKVSHALTWKGKLSIYQKNCAKRLCRQVNKHVEHLIWAVTGAGKTEMLFLMLAENLEKQKRIAIAAPRIDVCNELYPRLKQAFKEISMVLLHGQSSMKYHYAQLTVCTTHQLLKFSHAFDVLIIDEIDSFPFFKNKSLKFGAKRACKTNGSIVYLTATPDDEYQKAIRNGKISVDYLPLRFHQHPLPEIKFRVENQLNEKIKQQCLPRFVESLILKWVKNGNEFLIFVPRIQYLKPVLKAVQKIVPATVKGTSVHANDQERIKKVEALREHRLRFLVTTTILERGVTFKNIDLMVLDAQDNNFSCSSLVQIAGRVGRSFERPTGDVYFILQYYNLNVKRADKQIKALNRKARKLINER